MQPSVVVLQELWTRSATRAFTKRVQAAYPYIGLDRSWGRFPCDRVMEILGENHVYDTWARSDPRTKTACTWDKNRKAREMLSLGVHPRKGRSILTDQIGTEITDHLTVWGEFAFL